MRVSWNQVKTMDSLCKVYKRLINPTKPRIMSGDMEWLLKGDDKEFKKLLGRFVELYPFADKPKQKTSLMCILSRRLSDRFCGKSRY